MSDPHNPDASKSTASSMPSKPASNSGEQLALPAADAAALVRSRHFIELMVEEHLESGRFDGRVHTRFPPEPNGYLHIGHCLAIYVNFELAKRYGGKTNLRFDDTNPAAEEQEYVDAMIEDIHWLGYDWEDREYYASDYFQQLYDWAVDLVKMGKAYVDDSTVDEIRAMRGNTEVPGTESPYRNRSVEENLDLLARMKAGEFVEGSRVLRAKIDMASPNMHLRDPAMYRILDKPHHRTGTEWHIYPMYDWAHGQSDSIEGITHSLCTLEFEVHRPLYDWFVEQLGIYAPQQIEFARLNVEHFVTSKRKLRQLVEEGHVKDWDDPRMLTLRGMRRRGYPAEAIRLFCEKVGVAKRNGSNEFSLLEFSVREILNKTAARMMAVLDPVELVLENWPEGQTDVALLDNNPEDPESGQRELRYGGRFWIERSDFMVDPPRKFFRLAPGRMVRLKGAYIVECTGYEAAADGRVQQIRARYVKNSRSGEDQSGLKVKGTIHWVPVDHAVDAEVRVYDRLFSDPTPASHKDRDFLEFLNPDSLRVISGAKLEPALQQIGTGTTVQFLRNGYFCVDPDSSQDSMVFNRTVTLRDAWAKAQKPKQGHPEKKPSK
jgi:glutaminyl-tRNA synthetase